MSSFNWPPIGGTANIPTYANFAALPATATDGSAAITLDSDSLYIFNLGSHTWILAGGTGVPLSVGTINSQTKSANGAVFAANQLVMQTATATIPGLVTIGNLTDVGTDGIVVGNGTGSVIGSGTTIAQHVADTTHNGYLASTDWNTFNSKQPALTIGNLTDVGTDGIVVTNGAGSVIGTGTSIAQHVADTTHNGYLASADWNTFNSKGSGTVTTASVVTANGLAGTVATATTTPAITLTTSVTGIVKGNGTALSAATSGTDYSAGTSALGTGIVKSTTATGALTIAVAADFPTLNQNTTGTAAIATNMAGGLGGSVPYQTAVNATALLANGASGTFLKSNGTTLAPSWATPTISLTPPTTQKFLSGTGTYTTPTSPAPLYIQVRGSGGGGGGGGSGTGVSAGATNGGTTTFGTSLLSAAGGNLGGNSAGEAGGTGGAVSLGAAVGLAVIGGSGGPSNFVGATNNYVTGGSGGNGPLGGGGSGGPQNTAGQPGVTNAGGGGGGGGSTQLINMVSGSGGGAGGYFDARINTPLATYAYAIGVGGTAGAAGTGTGASVGGAGGSGVLIIDEYYQ